jgi:hypothetical protein
MFKAYVELLAKVERSSIATYQSVLAADHGGHF